MGKSSRLHKKKIDKQRQAFIEYAETYQKANKPTKVATAVRQQLVKGARR